MFKNSLIKLSILLSVSFTFLVFQNCSEVGFSGNVNDPGVTDAGDNITNTVNDNNPTNGTNIGDPSNTLGLLGGHFDLDTSSSTYSFSKGTTDKHVHEYDDKHDITYVDFFNMLDDGLKEINELVSSEKRFILVVANADLSPGGEIEINGSSISVTAYQQKVKKYLDGDTTALQIYTLGQANVIGDEILSSLKLKFEKDAILNGGLIPTQTGCVVNNDSGKNGEYRNGALTVQAIEVGQVDLDPSIGAAAIGSNILWEATLFWHKKDAGCYE